MVIEFLLLYASNIADRLFGADCELKNPPPANEPLPPPLPISTGVLLPSDDRPDTTGCCCSVIWNPIVAVLLAVLFPGVAGMGACGGDLNACEVVRWLLVLVLLLVLLLLVMLVRLLLVVEPLWMGLLDSQDGMGVEV